MNSYAIETKNVTLVDNVFATERACVLQFSPSDSTAEILTGVRIDNSHVLSVGHTNFFNSDLKIQCNNNPKDRIRVNSRLRHNRYDYKDNPAHLTDWALYDISIFKIDDKAPLSNAEPLEIVTDKNEVRSLLNESECIYGGAGETTGEMLPELKVHFTAAPKANSQFDLPSHLVLTYPGLPIALHGDSGGPVLCKKSDKWVLVGLLEYGGFMKAGNSSQNLNVIGLLILRPELYDGFILPNQNK